MMDEVTYNEGFLDGRELGYDEGYEQGLDGRELGYDEGYEQGYFDGFNDGSDEQLQAYELGYEQAVEDMNELLDLLEAVLALDEHYVDLYDPFSGSY